MHLTYDNKTISFFNFDLPQKVCISLSGGLDSASVLYLICKHFPQIEIIPFCARDLNAPKDADAAIEIVKWMQKQFPHVKIQDLDIYNFNDRDESFVSFKECDLAIKNIARFQKLNRVQVSKIIQVDRIAQSVVAKNDYTLRIDGMTRNPPKKDMKRLGFFDKAERRRDQGDIRPQLYRTRNNLNDMYQPYANADKKFVADVYRQNNLLDTLYPLTRSCVGTARQTDNFTKECRQCFWCYEKAWAFNHEWLYNKDSNK